MRLALETMFADEAGEVQIARGELLPGFLECFAAGAGVGRFTFIRVQLAAARTPQTAIRFLCAFEQEDFIALVEAVEQRGDFVGQLHARSEAGADAGGKFASDATWSARTRPRFGTGRHVSQSESGVASPQSKSEQQFRHSGIAHARFMA